MVTFLMAEMGWPSLLASWAAALFWSSLELVRYHYMLVVAAGWFVIIIKLSSGESLYSLYRTEQSRTVSGSEFHYYFYLVMAEKFSLGMDGA